MTLVMLFGALAGAGVLLLVLQYDSGQASGASELARLDAARARSARTARIVGPQLHDNDSMRARKIGASIREVLEARGWDLPKGVVSDLAVMGESVEGYLGMSVMTAVAGVFLPSAALIPGRLISGGSGLGAPVWLSLVSALICGVLPTLQLQSKAKERRRDFRHVVSAFLDLVAMNLAGGRGVPEALQSASALSNGWAMTRIRDTLQSARLQGITPWSALGQLGQDLGVDELRDMASALALVAEDGAKVRDSLSARAISMRQRELADSEGKAEQASQSMLVAQLLLCVGFLLFLIYPPVAQIVGF